MSTKCDLSYQKVPIKVKLNYMLWATEVEQVKNLIRGQISNFLKNITFRVYLIGLIKFQHQNQ